MARLFQPGLRNHSKSSLERGNASGCSVSSSFGSASRALCSRRRIQLARKRIKKLQTLMLDKTVDLWALDEVHFQQQGSRCRMWVPPETKDPIVYHHPTRKSVGYFGAVRLRDGKFFYRRENGKFNGETFWAFQKALRETSSMDPHRAIVISDNARYHHAQRRRTAAQVEEGTPSRTRNTKQSRETGASRDSRRSSIGRSANACAG